MYNGIGLQTARGSGTNGFVQRNLSFVRKHKDKIDFKSEEEMAKIDAAGNRSPNQEILKHERKRKVELKCVEMYELMEEQGYSPEEIEQKVSIFRKMLMQKEGVTESSVETDELGRPIAKDTHAIAEANQLKNQQLKAALGLGEHYVDGSSLDPNRRAKEEQARATAMAQQKYSILHESSPSPARSPSPEKKKKKKKKKNSRAESESPRRKDKKRKHRRHKKESSKKVKRETSDSSDEGSHSEESDAGSIHSHEHRRRRSRSSSRSRSPSPSSGRRVSRSPSIRRRHGSPSHLDKRRITRSDRSTRKKSYSRSRSRSRSPKRRARSRDRY